MNMLKEIAKRSTAKTPKFFIRLRNISLIMGAIATGLLTAPIALPAAVVTVAGYLLVGSTIAAGVSQLPVENPEEIVETVNNN